MDLITGQEGQINKLTITVCDENQQYAPKTGEEFVYTALINPEEIKKTLTIEYDSTQADGTTGVNLKFKKQKFGSLTIDLLFDGTGVLANDRSFGSNFLANQNPDSAKKQLDQFKKVVYEYDSDKHEPNVVQIKLGEEIILETCKLLSLDLTYSLFKPSGEPLRIKASCRFGSSIDDEERVKKENSKSPDLTHIRYVKEGDTLPLMCFNIYRNSSLYLEVARVNKLTNFRRLKVGDKLFFPPINKKER